MNRRMAGWFLAGCVFVSYYSSAYYALAEGPDPSLAEAARAAKTHFLPLTKDDLQAAKAELVAAVDQLDGRLKEDAANGEGWRKYTQLDKLQTELRWSAGPTWPCSAPFMQN